MTEPRLPATIAATDPLGRGVFSSRHAEGVARQKTPHHVFDTRGETPISVDRLDHAPDEEMARIGDENAADRGRNFYGWAVIEAGLAGENGRSVRPVPIPGDPYHAEITLPDAAVEDRDIQIQHANELAANSGWRPRPSR